MEDLVKQVLETINHLKELILQLIKAALEIQS